MAAHPTQGTLLYWSTSTAVSTASSCLVGQVSDISGPSGQKSEIDVTNLNSAGKEYLMSLPDFGELSFNLFYDGTDVAQNALYADWVSTATPKRKFVIKVADTTQYVIGEGYVKNFQWSMTKDDAVKAACSIRISGACTLSTTAA